MKNKIAPNSHEIVFPEDKLLISKTDTKGNITYANSIFCDISGYKEEELIAQQHNIVRHPDMPRLIFKLLWNALENNREFNAYIKNLTKDGSYYWVFANVTPTISPDNEVLGYYSVRRKPDMEKLDYIKNLYAELLDIEQQSTTQDAINKSLFKLNSVLNAREMGYEEFILSI